MHQLMAPHSQPFPCSLRGVHFSSTQNLQRYQAKWQKPFEWDYLILFKHFILNNPENLSQRLWSPSFYQSLSHRNPVQSFVSSSKNQLQWSQWGLELKNEVLTEQPNNVEGSGYTSSSFCAWSTQVTRLSFFVVPTFLEWLLPKASPLCGQSLLPCRQPPSLSILLH
jgi:hypothetical protein